MVHNALVAPRGMCNVHCGKEFAPGMGAHGGSQAAADKGAAARSTQSWTRARLRTASTSTVRDVPRLEFFGFRAALPQKIGVFHFAEM
jgi:hypothetical protein